MIMSFLGKSVVLAAVIGWCLGLTIIPSSAQTKRLGDGLSFEGAGASFIGSGNESLNSAARRRPHFGQQ